VPTHTFAQARAYNVTCTITNGTGSIVVPMSIPIGNAIKPPVVDIGFTYELVAGTTSLMKFTPSVTPANAVTSWKWEFGDNTDPVTLTGTSTAPQYHQYANTGTYNVILTTNAGVVTKQVIVGTPPPPRTRPGRH
jgi:PKD repeat protein